MGNFTITFELKFRSGFTNNRYYSSLAEGWTWICSVNRPIQWSSCSVQFTVTVPRSSYCNISINKNISIWWSKFSYFSNIKQYFLEQATLKPNSTFCFVSTKQNNPEFRLMHAFIFPSLFCPMSISYMGLLLLRIHSYQPSSL